MWNRPLLSIRTVCCPIKDLTVPILIHPGNYCHVVATINCCLWKFAWVLDNESVPVIFIDIAALFGTLCMDIMSKPVLFETDRRPVCLCHTTVGSPFIICACVTHVSVMYRSAFRNSSKIIILHRDLQSQISYNLSSPWSRCMTNERSEAELPQRRFRWWQLLQLPHTVHILSNWVWLFCSY